MPQFLSASVFSGIGKGKLDQVEGERAELSGRQCRVPRIGQGAGTCRAPRSGWAGVEWAGRSHPVPRHSERVRSAASSFRRWTESGESPRGVTGNHRAVDIGAGLVTAARHCVLIRVPADGNAAPLAPPLAVVKREPFSARRRGFELTGNARFGIRIRAAGVVQW